MKLIDLLFFRLPIYYILLYGFHFTGHPRLFLWGNIIGLVVAVGGFLREAVIDWAEVNPSFEMESYCFRVRLLDSIWKLLLIFSCLFVGGSMFTSGNHILGGIISVIGFVTYIRYYRR